MTVRFTRPLALLHVGRDHFNRLLNLPDDVTVQGFTLDHVRDAATFVIESERFASVPECTVPPELIGHIERVDNPDGTVTQRVTWPNIDTGYAVDYPGDTYRSTVRARQWTGDNEAEVWELCPEFYVVAEEDREGDPEATAEGPVGPYGNRGPIYDGDWIVQAGRYWRRLSDDDFRAEFGRGAA